MVARITCWISGLHRSLRNIHLVPLWVATAALAACGGGYMGSTTSSMPPPAAATAKIAVGPITGFGNGQVNVNGLQFVTTAATISVDGKAASQADLHAGDVVQIKGHHDSDSGRDIADDIDLRGNVEGAVTAIDTVAQTLVVLGQTVVVTPDTSFDDDISPASLAGLAVGDLVEVSGMPAADGTLQATRIERHAAGAQLQVIGVASATDATAKTLKINALLVDFTGATLAGFPASGPQDGDLIEATGTSLNAAGALVATRLELRTANDRSADANEEAEVEGLITRFASVSDFEVAGHAVTTSSSTTFEGGAASDLALNVRVEVEGSVDANGVIMARKVRIGHPADVRIMAQVDAVDAMGGTVTMLGIVVTVDSLTRLEDHGSDENPLFALTDIHTGDWLEVRATQSSAASTTVTATRIDRRDAQATVRLSGEVAGAAAPNFTMLSVTVATSGATQFSDGLDGGTFFADPVGKTVSVRGTWDGATLAASEVQLGENDDGDAH